jgi:Tol biopolymer transport system component
VPATGGVPRRLTYHPDADQFAGWTPDGKSVLFVSGRGSNSRRYGRLFMMPVNGVFPAEVWCTVSPAGGMLRTGDRNYFVVVVEATSSFTLMGKRNSLSMLHTSMEMALNVGKQTVAYEEL